MSEGLVAALAIAPCCAAQLVPRGELPGIVGQVQKDLHGFRRQVRGARPPGHRGSDRLDQHTAEKKTLKEFRFQ